MIDILEWDEFAEPMGFFDLLKDMLAFDFETTRYAIQIRSVGKFEEVFQRILN